MKSPTEVRAGSAVQAGIEVEVGLPSCLFQYVEFCIFNLHSHTRMLAQRRKELEDMVIYSGPLANAGEDNVGMVDGDKTPIPAALKYLEMQDMDEDIRVLRKRIDPLVAFIQTLGAEIEITDRKIILHYQGDCDDESLEILEKYYFVKRKPRWIEIEEVFHYSQRAFANKRNMLVKRAAGWLCGGMVKRR